MKQWQIDRAKLHVQLDSYGITSISYCQNCRAYTLDDIFGDGYSCLGKNLPKHFPLVDWGLFRRFRRSLVANTWAWGCNHCQNGYGLDICACGSREPPDKCRGGHENCGQPMQIWGGRQALRSHDAWGVS
jgi:rRNA maturation protein Nop10